jgi:hypothetical protein
MRNASFGCTSEIRNSFVWSDAAASAANSSLVAGVGG